MKFAPPVLNRRLQPGVNVAYADNPSFRGRHPAAQSAGPRNPEKSTEKCHYFLDPVDSLRSPRDASGF